MLCIVAEPSIPDIDDGEEPPAPSLGAEVDGEVADSQAGSTAELGKSCHN